MTDRSIQLAFDENIQNSQAIKVEISQGSSVSSILFLIYIKDLFKNRLLKEIRVPSYIDDIGLICHEKSAEENCKKLKETAQELFQMQTDYCV